MNYLKITKWLPVIISVFLFSIALTPSSLFAQTSAESEKTFSEHEWTDEEIIELGYVPDEVVVKFKEDKLDLGTSAGKKKADALIRNNAEDIGKEVIEKLKDNSKKSARINNLAGSDIDKLEKGFIREKKKLSFANIAVLKLGIDDAVYETIEALKDNPDIESVSPNYVFEFLTAPDDPYYAYDEEDPYQWGLHTIDIENAWDEMPGSPDNVVVAVLDSGIYHNHPDLGANMWSPSGDCKDENNQTIVGGCTNHGWDYMNEDDNPFDDNGHGTRVAGIIGAVTDNSTGVAGTAQNVEIMAVKIGGTYAVMTDVAEGIEFARNNGAQIINASFGSPYKINEMVALADFLDDDHLFVAAAGNSASNNDSADQYPANYGFDELISVAATDEDDALAYFEVGNGSNWGTTKVDIAAPGVGIMSTGITVDTELSEDFTTDLGDLIKDPSSPNYFGVDNTNGVYFMSVDTDADSIDDGYPNRNYTASRDYAVVTPGYDFSSSSVETAMLRFDVWCDTEPQYSKGPVPDYVEVSIYDGSIWHVLTEETIYEASLYSDINEDNIFTEVIGGYSGITFKGKEIIVPDAYMSSDTRFKLRWVSDSTNLDSQGQNESYAGCTFDNMIVRHVTGNTYDGDEVWGTSDAAPFVTGVAAMIWGAYPDLTASQVKQIILDSSDDISTENPTKPTVSDGRLNAYEAMLLADTVANPSVPTTIESVAGGGYWTSTSTWVGGVVPSSIDSVIINGNVTLNTNATVEDLTVNSGKIFKNRSNNNYTLTVNGDLTNDGTMQDATYHLIVTVGGDVDNSGTLENYSLTISGDLDNSGTLSVNNTYLAGDLVHSGTHTAYLYMNGASTQSVTASASLYYLGVQNDTVVTGDLTVANYLFVLSGKTLTFGSENTITVTGASGANNAGTVEGGAVAMSGDAQNFFGAGTWDVDSVTFSGTGTKTVQTTTITGDVTVGADAIIKNRTNSTYTLTINGDLVNDGTIQNGTSYNLNLVVGGDVDNNGTLSNLSLTISGDLDNSGTLSVNNTYLAGDLVHSGTHTAYLYMNGASTQSVTASASLYYLGVQNDTVVTGDLTVANYLFVLSGKTLTFGSENTITVTGASGANNAGTVEGGAVAMSGDAQNFFGAGTWDVDSVTFSGTGTKTVQTTTITGDVTVGADAILRPNSVHRTLTINGDLTNNGTIEDYSGDRIYIYLGSDLDNNGTMNNYATYADWEAVGGADSYDFQYTDTSDVWQTEVTTGTNTHYSITAFENDDRRWRWRSVEDSTPSAWSSDKYIN